MEHPEAAAILLPIAAFQAVVNLRGDPGKATSTLLNARFLC